MSLEDIALPRFESSSCDGFKIEDLKPGDRKAGGGEGIRTPDPMVANHVLCQLSYRPWIFPARECGRKKEPHFRGVRSVSTVDALRAV